MSRKKTEHLTYFKMQVHLHQLSAKFDGTQKANEPNLKVKHLKRTHTWHTVYPVN